MLKMKIPGMTDPAFIDRLHVRKPGTAEIVPDAVLASLSAAMKAATEAMKQLADLEEAISNDKTITPAAAKLKLKQAAMKLGERAAKAIDAARAKAAEEIAAVNASMLPPLPPAGSIERELEAEARRLLFGADEKERSRILAKAVEAGDAITVGAIARARKTPWMVGMAEQEVAVRLDRYQAVAHPAERDRVQRLTKAIEATERGGKSVVAAVTNFVAALDATGIEAIERKAAEALAAVG